MNWMPTSNPCSDDLENHRSWTSRKDPEPLEQDQLHTPMTDTRRIAPPGPNGRLSSFISKLTSTVTSKPKTFADFFITTSEDPRPRYAPGDLVKGWINLVIQKPTKITHIVVYLQGFVKVYKSSTAPGEGLSGEASLGRGGFGTGSQAIHQTHSTVCGDGRLSPGRYRFGFTFQLPSENLPSSIDFERGTISYVLSAVLTRPTTISPTVTCEKKFEILESIDISEPHLSKPEKRAVSLRPVGKPKKSKAHKASQTEPKTPSIAPSQRTQTTGRPSSAHADQPEVKSPSVSEFSTQSGVTGSSESGPLQAVTIDTGEGSQARSSQSNGNVNGDQKRTIELRIDLLRTGYLPGDTIPVKLVIRHHKHVQNMRGVIVTLYRKARVDSRTDRALAKTKSRGESIPKSRTAFGGLTFATPRPDHTFRMDLAQSFTPMVTNPNTFVAEVKTSVHIPDDVFPTISCVPDEMINFSYHLEVIMDVNGKLAGFERLAPWMSMTADPSNPTLGQAAQQSFHATGMNQFFDTTAIRRKDTIPDCSFDIIIGTKDSNRKATKRRLDEWDLHAEQIRTRNSLGDDSPNANEILGDHDTNTPPPPPLIDETPRPPPTVLATNILPPPEEPMDEKERLRRAELRLLPSAPEGDNSLAGPSQPTAPLDDFDDSFPNASAPAYDVPSAPPPELINGTNSHTFPETVESSQPAVPMGPSDDKHELERQRLLASASAPDYDHAETRDTGPSAPTTAPSAPVVEEEEYNEDSTTQTIVPSAPLEEPPPTRERVDSGVADTNGVREDGLENSRVHAQSQTHDSFADHGEETELPTYQR